MPDATEVKLKRIAPADAIQRAGFLASDLTHSHVALTRTAAPSKAASSVDPLAGPSASVMNVFAKDM